MNEPGEFTQDQARVMWRALSSIGTDVAEKLLALQGAGQEEDQVFVNGVRDTVDVALLRVRKLAEPREPREDEADRSLESRRQEVIENAVTAAELVILEGSNGTTEETDYLTASVAAAFVDKSRARLSDNLLTLDLSRGQQTNVRHL